MSIAAIRNAVALATEMYPGARAIRVRAPLATVWTARAELGLSHRLPYADALPSQPDLPVVRADESTTAIEVDLELTWCAAATVV